MVVERTIFKRIEQYLFKGKIIAIYGVRQVGKTTLVKELIKKFPEDAIYLNCDEPDVRALLSNKTSTELKFILGNKRLVVIDEAQRVKRHRHYFKINSRQLFRKTNSSNRFILF